MTTGLEAARAALHVRAHGPCPMCGQDTWVGGHEPVGLPHMNHGHAEAPLLEVLPFVCTNCGFLRLHSLQPFETHDD